MSRQPSYPALFDMSGYSIAQAIIMIIAQEPRLKARQIAYRLNTRYGFADVERRDVNSLLYGGLRTQVSRTDDYRWELPEAQIYKHVPPASPVTRESEQVSVTLTPVLPYEKNPKISFWDRVKFIFNL